MREGEEMEEEGEDSKLSTAIHAENVSFRGFLSLFLSISCPQTPGGMYCPKCFSKYKFLISMLTPMFTLHIATDI